MPNHCSNSLTVTGDDAGRFFAAIERHSDENFVREFIPMPEELSGIYSGSCVIDGEQVKHWRHDADDKPVKITDLEQQHLIDLHGTVDWYDWCIKNWGTKWGAYDVEYDGKATIRFDSAWSPPMAAIDTISTMFPHATFTLAYAEGGAGYWGVAVIQNGGVIDADESDQFWSDDADWDNEDADILDRLTPECRDHIETHGLHTGG